MTDNEWGKRQPSDLKTQGIRYEESRQNKKLKWLYYLEYIILEARIAEKTNYFKQRKDHGNKKLFLESQLEGEEIYVKTRESDTKIRQSKNLDACESWKSWVRSTGVMNLCDCLCVTTQNFELRKSQLLLHQVMSSTEQEPISTSSLKIKTKDFSTFSLLLKAHFRMQLC